MGDVILKAIPVLFVVGVLYLALLLIHPMHECPRCGGARVIRSGRNVKACKKCKATGRAIRFGAPFAHKLAREHVWPWIRARMEDTAERMREGPR
jgi:hypothetical protein